MYRINNIKNGGFDVFSKKNSGTKIRVTFHK